MTDKHPVIVHLTAPDRFRTQTRLAAAAGIMPHTLSEKVRSKNPLTFEQMGKILRAAPDMGVAVTPADFFPEFSEASQADAA